MASSPEVDELSKWLTNADNALPLVDHQDGEWVIAASFKYDQLLPLIAANDLVPRRRDAVVYALVLQLEGLIDPNDTGEPYDDASAPVALHALSEFVRGNWSDVLRIDREIGFGVDFEELVVPYIRTMLGGEDVTDGS